MNAKSSTTYWLTGENWPGESKKVMKVTYKGMKLYVDGYATKKKALYGNSKGRERKYHKKCFQISKKCMLQYDNGSKKYKSVKKENGPIIGFIELKIENNKVVVISSGA